MSGDAYRGEESANGGCASLKDRNNQHIRDWSNITCRNCNQRGHKWRKCPNQFGFTSSEKNETTNAMAAGTVEDEPLWDGSFGDGSKHNDGTVLCQKNLESRLQIDQPETELASE